jgi:hypothetical protein
VIATPEQWQAFTEHFMQYVYDSPDENDPSKPGTFAHHGEYWQTPEETVGRVEKGHTLGDCDDYAFLAQSILARQGQKSYVIEVPGHAICAWIKVRPDGLYEAYSICTYGYDRNGKLGMPNDPQKEGGYKTPQEAFNALVSKYTVPRLGVVKPIDYKVTDGNVTLLTIPEKGKRERNIISVNDLVI